MNDTPIPGTTGPNDGELERQGVIRIATERYEVGGYRYDRLSDALAEAKRRNALRDVG